MKTLAKVVGFLVAGLIGIVVVVGIILAVLGSQGDDAPATLSPQSAGTAPRPSGTPIIPRSAVPTPADATELLDAALSDLQECVSGHLRGEVDGNECIQPLIGDVQRLRLETGVTITEEERSIVRRLYALLRSQPTWGALQERLLDLRIELHE